MMKSQVIPIFKNDDETLVFNYRPTSLLPVFSKVVNKGIYNQIHSFVFTENALFNVNQYGSKSVHSTEYAIMEVIDVIITALDSNEHQSLYF